MARLFVAVWPTEDVLDLLGGLPQPAIPGVRWTTREQWHVTLRFLGAVPDVSLAVDALSSVQASACTATLGPALGRFGQRVLHVPVGGLSSVAVSVIDATAGVGRPPEPRPFKGHITLARSRDRRGRVDLRPFAGAAFSASWPVREVCLVESRLGRGPGGGAAYEVVARVPLVL